MSSAIRLNSRVDLPVPEAIFTRETSCLQRHWEPVETEETLILELGLKHEFMIQLATVRNFTSDPFIGLCAALSNLRPGEVAVFQVIFEPVRHAWSESILRSVTDASGKNFFVNQPDLAAEARKKIARPLYAAV